MTNNNRKKQQDSLRLIFILLFCFLTATALKNFGLMCFVLGTMVAVYIGTDILYGEVKNDN